MPWPCSRCHLNDGSRGDELGQLRMAASNQPYAVCAACQSKSLILQQRSRSSTLVDIRLIAGRHRIEVQHQAAAAAGQAPLLPPAASLCTAALAWQPLLCEEVVHSSLAMEALESTRMAAELDLDPISKFRARSDTRTRRAQPVEPARRSGANFALCVNWSLISYLHGPPHPCK